MGKNLEKAENACNQYFHWFECVYVFFLFSLYKENSNHRTAFDNLSANAFILKNVLKSNQ